MSNNTNGSKNGKSTKSPSKVETKTQTGDAIVNNIIQNAAPEVNPAIAEMEALKAKLAESEAKRLAAEGELNTIKSTVRVKKDRKPRSLLPDAEIERRFAADAGRINSYFSALESHSYHLTASPERETKRKGHSLAISTITMQNNFDEITAQSKVPATLRDAKADLNILKYKVIDMCVSHGLLTKEEKKKAQAEEAAETSGSAESETSAT